MEQISTQTTISQSKHFMPLGGPPFKFGDFNPTQTMNHFLKEQKPAGEYSRLPSIFTTCPELSRFKASIDFDITPKDPRLIQEPMNIQKETCSPVFIPITPQPIFLANCFNPNAPIINPYVFFFIFELLVLC